MSQREGSNRDHVRGESPSSSSSHTPLPKVSNKAIDYIPKIPPRPGVKRTISTLTIGNARSLRMAELQSAPTTEISFQNASKQQARQSGFLESTSIYGSMFGGRTHENSDAYTICTNPTLRIYTDNEDNDMESSFTERLEHIISQPNSDFNVPHEDPFDDDHNPAVADGKQFWILSDAGKLIYAISSSDDEDQDEDKYIGYVGVIQTVISSFKLDGSELKSLISTNTKIVIMNQSPIILVAVSKLNEPEEDLMNQLDLLYSFLLSTLGKPQIIRSFQNKQGFDLRKHLGRADLSGLDCLTRSLIDFDIGVLIGALQSVRVRKTIRTRLNQVLLNNKNKSTLYGLLVAPGGKLISIMRPKKHTLHTTDLQVLFSLVFNQYKNQGSGLDEDEELWMPVCLSKFNPNGFLYSFVKFIGNFALILIGADKNSFFEMRETAQMMIKEMETKQLLSLLQEAISRPLTTVEIQVPLIHHFIFKSKKNLQYIVPTLKSNTVKNLQKYYIKLHSSIDRASNISVSYVKWESPIKSTTQLSTETPPASSFITSSSSSSHQHRSHSIISTSATSNKIQESSVITGLAWSTPNYELLVLAGNGMKKDILISNSRGIVNWCRKYEERLFVHNGAVF